MAAFTAADAAELFRSEPQQFIPADAGEIAYRKVGSGPDVLFVHGWPVSGATFRCLLPHLVDHVTCHLIDMPSAGSSRFNSSDNLSLQNHIGAVTKTMDALGLDDVAVVGHDSGGLIARHAVAGDARVRSMGLINTEPAKPSWRFRSFLAGRRAPGFARIFGWLAGQEKLRANKFVLGDAFVDRSLLGGEFEEFFLQPLHTDATMAEAATKVLRTFEFRYVHELDGLHAKIDVPVVLVWGVEDPFFPLAEARKMVATFPNAKLVEIPNAGLFSHEEKPAEVAAALLPTLVG